MSSTYRLICLSHDPGFTLRTEWSGRDGRAIAEHALINRDATDEVQTHQKCDLVIGRYSYPLIEVGYLRDLTSRHVEWVDVEWVRLLAATFGLMDLVSDVPAVATQDVPLPQGWTRERVRWLGYEL